MSFFRNTFKSSTENTIKETKEDLQSQNICYQWRQNTLNYVDPYMTLF